MEGLKGRKLAMFCTDGSPADSPDIKEALGNVLIEEQLTYAGLFYCPGGIAYERTKTRSRLAMKSFAAVFRKKEQDRGRPHGGRDDGAFVRYIR